MKQKTINVHANYGIGAETGWFDGGFRLVVSNEKQRVVIHLVNARFMDLLWQLGDVAAKRAKEAAEMVALAPGRPR